MTDLVKTKETVNTDNDNIIIVDCFETVRGGRTLDVTDYTDKVISAGHVIITDTATKKIIKPLPKNGTLATGYKYVGVLTGSISTEKPLASIMVRGTINTGAFKEATGITIPDDVKAKLNLINFI